MIEHEEPDGDIEQAETYHRKTHHGAATEGNLQTGIHALAGSIGCTGRGVCGGLHAKESCQTGEETTGEEGKRHPGILNVKSVSHESKECTKHHEDDTDYLVLLLKVSHSTFAHIKRNLFHTRRTLVGLHHLGEEVVRHTQCHDRCDGHEPKYCGNHHVGLINYWFIKLVYSSAKSIRPLASSSGSSLPRSIIVE